MLKQVFDNEQFSKAISSSDVWQWNLLGLYDDVDSAISHTAIYWSQNDQSISALLKRTSNTKTVFVPSRMEDAFAIKLLDRFIRRIYKVRQSDRNRIIRQLSTLLKDSGDYNVLRLDIKKCYESILFEKLLQKIEDEMILAPICIKYLKSLHSNLQEYNFYGLPRGLSISPTLAELYLEKLDYKIASHPSVIFSARYVDDIVIFTPKGKETDVKDYVSLCMSKMGLSLNTESNKFYIGSSRNADFAFLGYSFKVTHTANKANKVLLKISNEKLNKIKSKIAVSLSDYKRENNFQLLKRRLEYLSMLKTVKRGKNGDLLAGIAHHYQYVTDEFACLKQIDGFLCEQLSNPRFGLTFEQKSQLKRISFYQNARKKKVGKFSKRKAAVIVRVWENV